LAASPCLASRIRYGLEVTSERLVRVDRAETAVRGLLASAWITVTDLRVRDLGDSVRIELPAGDLSAAQEVPFLAEAVRQAGFADVAVEYATFSPGSLNGKSIAKPQSGP
jgi:uncharacterized protein